MILRLSHFCMISPSWHQFSISFRRFWLEFPAKMLPEAQICIPLACLAFIRGSILASFWRFPEPLAASFGCFGHSCLHFWLFGMLQSPSRPYFSLIVIENLSKIIPYSHFCFGFVAPYLSYLTMFNFFNPSNPPILLNIFSSNPTNILTSVSIYPSNPRSLRSSKPHVASAGCAKREQFQI